MTKTKLGALGLTAVLLAGCTSLSNFMDSSHGPQGNTITAKTAPAASQSKTTLPSAQASQKVKSTPQAGVVKPYAAYAKDAESIENELLGTAVPAAEAPKSTPVPQAAEAPTSAAALTVAGDEEIPVIRSEPVAQAQPEAQSGPQIIDITKKSDNHAVQELTRGVTLSGHCTGDLNSKVQNYAQELTIGLARKLQVDGGEIFVAPTVIPDEYQDCVSDAAQSIKNAFAQTANFKPSSISEASIYQNAGSSTVIPRLVRACRAKGVPYLCYSILGTRGNKLRLTIRIIRISDGITLTQDYKNLD
ncbi:MAG: hypothetical protein K6F05_07615 [Succinivibrio sp.]|nr:hypothetical protein [Succinivibrio sp.]